MAAAGRKALGWSRAAAAVRIVAAIVAVVTIALLTTTHVRWSAVRVIDPPAVKALRDRFAAGDTSAELRERLREADARERARAFALRARLNAGGWVLGGSLAAFFAASAVLIGLSGRRRAVPMAPRELLERRGRTRAAMAWAAGGGAAVGLALGWAAPKLPDIATIAPPEARRTAAPAAAAAAGGAADWLAEWGGFRGPGGRGGVGYAGMPGRAAGVSESWRAELPAPGHSSPCIWDQMVFVTCGDATETRLLAFAADDGAALWNVRVDGDYEGMDVYDEGMWAASTPTADGHGVYVISPSGLLLAFDRRGQERWRRFLGPLDNAYGHCSSPMAAAGVLYVQVDDTANSIVRALDPATGKDIWTRCRSNRGASWSSPVLVEGVTPALAVLCEVGLDLLAADDGRALGYVEFRATDTGTSPAAGGGLVFVSSAEAGVVACDPARNLATSWTWDDLPASMATPLVVGGELYVGDDSGTLTCLDARDGKALWSAEVDGGFYASPVLAGDGVWAISREGELRVFDPGREHRERFRYAVGEGVSATPAFARRRAVVRGEKHLIGLAVTVGEAAP